MSARAVAMRAGAGVRRGPRGKVSSGGMLLGLAAITGLAALAGSSPVKQRAPARHRIFGPEHFETEELEEVEQVEELPSLDAIGLDAARARQAVDRNRFYFPDKEPEIPPNLPAPLALGEGLPTGFETGVIVTTGETAKVDS